MIGWLKKHMKREIREREQQATNHVKVRDQVLDQCGEDCSF